MGAGIELTEEILDQIVPPGTDVNPDDNYNADAPGITDKRSRRR